MPTDRPAPTTRRTRPLPARTAVGALALLAVPYVVLLIVPLYARRSPELLGFPFFYWFELAMVLVCAALTALAYRLVERAPREGADR